jgi:hypothetical protein
LVTVRGWLFRYRKNARLGRKKGHRYDSVNTDILSELISRNFFWRVKSRMATGYFVAQWAFGGI